MGMWLEKQREKWRAEGREREGRRQEEGRKDRWEENTGGVGGTVGERGGVGRGEFSGERQSGPSSSKHIARWIRMNIQEKVQGLM